MFFSLYVAIILQKTQKIINFAVLLRPRVAAGDV